jgi:methyltransferase (TIGR00027 family)
VSAAPTVPERDAAPAATAADAYGTAELVAAFRAAEQGRPSHKRIFSDPYADLFVTDKRLRALVARPRLARLIVRFRERVTPGIIGEALLRYRYAEDVLRGSGCQQLVVIGAGYDSTAMRLGPATDVRVFELDHPGTQARKQEILLRELPGALERSVMVPCDLRVERVSQALARTDFDPSQPAVFNWIGVSMYLSRDEVETTIRDLASIAAPGSRLVFDYMEAGVIDGTTPSKSAKRAAADVAKRGEPFRFGLRHDEPTEFLAPLGWSVRESIDADALMRRTFPGGSGLSGADYMGLVDAERPS